MNIERCLTVDTRTLRPYSMLRSLQVLFDSFSLSRPNRSNPSSTSRSIPDIAFGSASILYFEYRIPNYTPDLIPSVECSVLSRHAIVLPTSTVRFLRHSDVVLIADKPSVSHQDSPPPLDLPRLVSAFVDELFLLPAARLRATSEF